jgi:hypothetical protein
LQVKAQEPNENLRKLSNKAIADQLASAVSSLSQGGKEEVISRITGALARFYGLEPRDAAEDMLAAQIVATHDAAMAALNNATRSDFTPVAELYLKFADKMFTQNSRKLEQLDKRQGKQQESVIVGRVSVNEGGQAIVGHVSSGGPGDRSGQPAAPAGPGPAPTDPAAPRGRSSKRETR